MIKKWYAAETFGGVIQLGKAGEGEAVQLAIDVSGWMEEYPDGEIRFYVTPPKPLTPYFAAIEMQEDGTATWTIGKADTQCAGSGTLELMMIRGEDTLLKSATASTTIAHSPSANTPAGDAPETHPTWWKDALDKIGEAQTQALAGVEAAKEAAVGAVEGAFDEEEAAGKAAIQAAGAAQTQAVNSAGAAQQAAIENKAANALASIPEEYTELDKTVKSLKDHKADVIADVSERAAAHELHAQDGPMSVTLHGKTTETGSGDKSPDNPYVISGVDAAQVRVGSKNLLDTSVQSDGTIKNDNGEDVSDVTSRYFVKMIAVIPGESLHFNFGAQRVYQYGSDKRWLRRTASFSSVSKPYGVFVVPGDCYYIQVQVRIAGDEVSYNLDHAQVEVGSTESAYEPYNANVITPPLLPLNADGTGDPLYGNGTVDDIVENDVPSGCDVRIELDGSEDELYQLIASFENGIRVQVKNITDCKKELAANEVYFFSDQFPARTQAVPGVYMGNNPLPSIFYPGVTSVAGLRDALAANPLTCYYRSTDYTPDKDLRVCRVTRRTKRFNADEINDRISCVTESNLLIAKFKFGAKKSFNSIVSEILPTLVSDVGWGGYEGTYACRNRYYNDQNIEIFVRGMRSIDEYRSFIMDHDLELYISLATPEVYMTDPYELRKPTGLIPVTVTGSGETAVEYPHDTKHYIDGKISELVTLALANS